MYPLPAPRVITALFASILLLIAGYALLFAVRETTVPTVSTGEYVVRVDSRMAGWQSAGIAVERGAAVRVGVIDGRWTHFVGQAPSNSGTGGDYICADVMSASACIEPLPDFPQGGLVGRIGTRTFAIGESTALVAPASGPVQLRINDADEGLYDNEGILTVRVTVGP